MGDAALYDELDGNHLRVGCRSVQIHGDRALHRTLIGEFDRILTKHQHLLSVVLERDLLQSDSSGLGNKILVFVRDKAVSRSP